jgi:hypothetical protein
MDRWTGGRIDGEGPGPTGAIDHRPTGRSVHPSTCPPVHPSTRPPVHPSTRPSVLGKLLILLLGAAGCFFGKSPENTNTRWSADVPLHVVNNHWLDVAVYVIHDGQRTRLGVAGGTAETQLTLPHYLVGMGGHIQLYGDPIGSLEQAVTEVLNVQPGQFIEWLLEWGLERSSVSVY